MTQGMDGPINALDAAVQVRDSDMLGMVQRAVEQRQVLLAFQPIVRSHAPDTVAFHEALVRVPDTAGRIIPAKDFMPFVEETELGRMLDCIALHKGLEELSRVPDLRLSVNMSARSIGYRKWMRVLMRGLEADPTVAERLILEITESSAMLVPEIVTSFMQDLQRKGIAFALDDFGAGYTALRFLRDFNFDVLKIDGQFIRNIDQNADNQVLVRAMLSIAEQFDMFTVAERVETEGEAHCLIDMGANCLQGFLFAAPTIAPHWRNNAQGRYA